MIYDWCFLETRKEKQSEVLESLGRWVTSTMLPCSLAYYRSNPSLASIGEASEVGELPLCQLADLFFWGFSCTEGNVTGVCVVICHSPASEHHPSSIANIYRAL
jgi:hypothetical protein